MTTYYFIAASQKFLTEEEPLEEILKERRRNYKEHLILNTLEIKALLKAKNLSFYYSPYNSFFFL